MQRQPANQHGSHPNNGTGSNANASGREAEQRPLIVRLAWFAAIWAASVAALTVVAMLIRLAL